MNTQTAFGFDTLDALVFAGGGNRCWWQAGIVARLSEQQWRLPPKLVGTSAGAAIAASCLTHGPEAALQSCIRLYAETERIFDWHALATRAKFIFAHQKIYPDWVRSFINSDTFATLKKSDHSLSVAVSRPIKNFVLSASLVAGTVAYMIDKKVWHSIHPRLPKLLGLRQEFIDLSLCESVGEVQAVLSAAAAVPPFMRPLRLNGRWAFDGGYTDNAPIPKQFCSKAGGTLVLLTRYYPDRPAVFFLRDRYYWQPSRKIPVSTWDCTSNATVNAAFELGYKDAQAMIRAGILYP